MRKESPDVVMTPLHIEISLHYFKYREYENVTYMSLDVDVSIKIQRELHDAGLLEIAADKKHWKATDKMRQYVETLCKVPFNLPEVRPDLVRELNAVLDTGSQFTGEDTIKTRNNKIAAAIDEYLATTPQSMI